MTDKRTFNVEAIIDTVEWTAEANVVRGRAQVALLPPWSSKDRAFDMFRPRRGKIRRIEYEDGSVDEFHVEEKRRLAAPSGGLAEALREAKRHGTLEKVRRDIERQSPTTRANLAGRFKVD